MIKNIAIGVLAVLTLLFGYLNLTASKPLGVVPTGPAHYQTEAFLQGLVAGPRNNFVVDNTGRVQVGSNGTLLTQYNAGTCVAKDTATIAASTTKQVDCGGGYNGATALSGVSAPAIVQFTSTTSMPTTYAGLVVLGASASSTAGFITLNIYNGTGATFTWTNTASSSFAYTVLK